MAPKSIFCFFSLSSFFTLNPLSPPMSRLRHLLPVTLLTLLMPTLGVSAPAAAPAPNGDLPAIALMKLTRPLVIAHRGYSGIAPENTIPSYELAIAAGADLVELDYYPSKDGVPMIFHDATLDRTTDATAVFGQKGFKIADKTAAELKTLDAGKWFHPRFAGTRIPTFVEALDFIQKNSVTLIERKAGDAAACVQLLKERDLINKLIVQSFDWEYLSAFHALAPDQVLGALGPASTRNGKKLTAKEKILSAVDLDLAVKAGAKVVGWSANAVTADSIKQAHARGLKVWIYTVNEVAEAQKFMAWGADGIIGNHTSLIWKALATR